MKRITNFWHFLFFYATSKDKKLFFCKVRIIMFFALFYNHEEMHMERLLFLDTETTGLHPENGDRIIEIGIVEMIDRELTGRTFHAYCNPQRAVPDKAYAIHGLSYEFLKDKPLFVDIAEDFLAFLYESPSRLLAHSADFDLGFINNELAMASLPALNLPVEDTLVLARQLFSGKRHSLDSLCKLLLIDNTQRVKHSALLDAHLLAQVYLSMTKEKGSFKISFSTD
jgi:DNA polymerase-3 subunit epsilon